MISHTVMLLASSLINIEDEKVRLEYAKKILNMLENSKDELPQILATISAAYLMGVAFRTLTKIEDAEDVIQESYRMVTEFGKSMRESN